MRKSNSIAKKRSSIAAKLAISFVVLIALVSVVDWLALRQISRADADFDAMVDARWERVELAREAQSYSNLNSRLILQTFITDNQEETSDLLAQAADNSRHVSELIDSLRSKADGPEESDLLADIQTKREAYRTSYRHAVDLHVHEQKPDEARVLMVREVSPLLVVYHRAMDDYVQHQGKWLDEAQAANVRANAKARREALILISLATLFALAIAIAITTYTAKQLARRVRAEDKLRKAHQDLEAKVVNRTAALLEANHQLQTEAAERLVVESALRESEQRYRQIVDCASDTIYRTNVKGFFTFVNPSAAGLVRRTVDQCLGVHFLDLIRDDFRAAASEFYRQQVASQTPITYFEFPAVASDGSVVWIGQKVQLVMEDDRVVELQGIARDVTTRKEIEEQLLESESRYRLLFESNPQPMWVFDTDSLAFLAVNDAAVRTYGYSRAEFLGMTIKDIRPADEIPSLFSRKAMLADGFGSYDASRSWHHRKKDGGIIEVEITWHTLDFAGRPAKLVLAQDVTERRRAEAEALFQQTRFQQLFENAPLGIVRVDQNDRIVDANKEFQTIFQFSLDEIKDRPINDAIVPKADKGGAKELSSSTLRGRAVKTEAFRQRKDQTLVRVQIFGVPIVIDEELAGVFAIYINLTEREKAEEEKSKLTEQIEAQRQRLNNILETIPCVVWENAIDPSASNAPASFVNSYIEKMNGYTVEEWLSAPDFWYSTIHPEDKELVEEGNAELFAEGRVRNELRWITKDGDAVWGENQIVLVRDSGGQPVGVRGVTTDITERKRAEAALRSSERKYRDIFTFAPVGIYQSLPDGTIVAANNALAEMLGYESVGDLLQARLDRDIYLDDQERRKLINEYETRGYARDLQVRWKKKDGSPIWVELTAHAIKGTTGATEYFEGFVHDITQPKRMQDERQVISEIIQGVINTADLNELLSLIHQSIGRYLYAENCFVALYDEVTELMHFPFWVDKFDARPEARPVGIGFSSFVLRTGKPMLVDRERTEQMYRRGEVEKSGSTSASWLGVPLRTPSRTIGVLVVQHYEEENTYDERDLEFLTSVGSQIAMAIERKRSEQALFAANQRALADYESLVERIAALGRTLGTARDLKMIFRALRDFAVASVPCDGLVISLYDREKGSRRIVYCWTDNEELDSSNGTEVAVRDGMVGRAIKSGAVVIDNDYCVSLADNPTTVAIGSKVDLTSDRSGLAAPMTIMGRTVGCVEVQCRRAGAFGNGHETAMRMSANLAANAIENVVLIEREQEKEEQLRQAQKMESIGTLAGGIAHDFNNLMTAVTGYSDLALRGELEDSLRTKITEIKKAGERAANLTRQLLAFSRKQMLQPEVLDLNGVINGMIRMLPRLIGEHITISLKLSGTLGRIKADPGQIEQVLLNLAVNGRDAMPQGGYLTIETRNVHLSQPIKKVGSTIEPGNYVLLSVSDNGCGMDAETQEQIFEPFFTTKGVGKGTGLGLSTVYGIVKQSGGNVWVYSEPGKGTAFKIYLPRVDEVEEAEIGLPVPAASRGNETILLVEDEEQVRNLSKEILEGYGYSVLAAPDGSAGLSLGKEFPGRIDLVLTDVIMPQMGGKELVDQLKSVRPESKILFMSGFTDDAIIHHGVSDDGVFFLQKPFSTECLAAKVREVLDQ